MKISNLCQKKSPPKSTKLPHHFSPKKKRQPSTPSTVFFSQATKFRFGLKIFHPPRNFLNVGSLYKLQNPKNNALLSPNPSNIVYITTNHFVTSSVKCPPKKWVPFHDPSKRWCIFQVGFTLTLPKCLGPFVVNVTMNVAICRSCLIHNDVHLETPAIPSKTYLSLCFKGYPSQWKCSQREAKNCHVLT